MTPIIYILDNNPDVLKTIEKDLAEHYGDKYRLMFAEQCSDALSILKDLCDSGETVAMLLSDQNMPNMSGVEFLKEAQEIFPKAMRVLLTAYHKKEDAVNAINEIGLDYYLMKPWDPPEEKLYPVLDDILEEWQSHHVKDNKSGIQIVGYQYSKKTHEIKEFLSGNLFPFKFFKTESAKGQELLKKHNLNGKKLPVVIFEDNSFLERPELTELGEKVGLSSHASAKFYDVIIIGAGPAGLAAAVYGASEGLKTLLIERHSPGGQAGTSSRIENYLGFPSGLSGAELTRRAITQAERLGAEFLTPQEVTEIAVKGDYKIVKLADGTDVRARSIVITTGVDWRKLEVQNVDKFTGAGIYYGSATTEAIECRDKDVYIVGAGNSAGQAAVYLANYANNVKMLILEDSLKEMMSQYLIDQIESTENIEVLPKMSVVAVEGEKNLEKVIAEHLDTKEKKAFDAGALFIFIGAKPFTDWIKLNIFKDERGFIETGRDLMKHGEKFKKVWHLDREPFLLETCTPGIFAAGDVRSGAINRIASAVGDGAMAIKFVHEYLAE
ncbi:MAG: FAD-dependent oxidoreductase [Bacteroidota bacterium]